MEEDLDDFDEEEDLDEVIDDMELDFWLIFYI